MLQNNKSCWKSTIQIFVMVPANHEHVPQWFTNMNKKSISWSESENAPHNCKQRKPTWYYENAKNEFHCKNDSTLSLYGQMDEIYYIKLRHSSWKSVLVLFSCSTVYRFFFHSLEFSDEFRCAKLVTSSIAPWCLAEHLKLMHIGKIIE